ncbi:MAG: segregation/condensation protein A [Actinobacteria bacterium]|uniref:Unannotated protein n=1 Tax=freshwater metagenome TaxID=449393 RepID=A0A6J7GEC4_9ZZZZ|nr:segregation/condensation protein A [Actinomycetota bacterium]
MSPSDVESAARHDDELGFRLSVGAFDGPFDLLLSLIAKHELDITEIALSVVTDEFIKYLKGLTKEQELEQATEFLVVAATLLDLKIAGLLPQGELVDSEDAALFEARDILFARLLQYRAFKDVSAWFGERIDTESVRHLRQVRLEDKYRSRLPELVWSTSPEDFAALALLALAPREIPVMGLDHLHAPLVSIREQAAHVVAILRRGRPVNFRELIADATSPGVIVARFLAILELYRNAAITFVQDEPLGDLTLTWAASEWTDENLAHLGADYDR